MRVAQDHWSINRFGAGWMTNGRSNAERRCELAVADAQNAALRAARSTAPIEPRRWRGARRRRRVELDVRRPLVHRMVQRAELAHALRLVDEQVPMPAPPEHETTRRTAQA